MSKFLDSVVSFWSKAVISVVSLVSREVIWDLCVQSSDLCSQTVQFVVDVCDTVDKLLKQQVVRLNNAPLFAVGKRVLQYLHSVLKACSRPTANPLADILMAHKASCRQAVRILGTQRYMFVW